MGRPGKQKKKNSNVEASRSEEEAGPTQKKSASAKSVRGKRDPSAQESAMAELETLNHESEASAVFQESTS